MTVHKMTLADWEKLYGDDAASQGWSIFYTGGAPGHDSHEIEAIDEVEVFNGDDGAMLYVVEAAKAGDSVCCAAIAALFNEGCHQALAETLLCYLNIDTHTGFFAEADPPDEPAVSLSSMPETHARFAPSIVLYEKSHIDPVTGIAVYTNAEADHPYRFLELADGKRHWYARVVVGRRADGVPPYAFEARIDGTNDLETSILFVEVDDTEDGTDVIGPQRKMPIAWIDAIFIY